MPVFEQVLEKYPNKVKVAFKNYPLRNHKFARPAAIAALAAGKQGKFWEFHDQLFKNYNKLNEQKINEIAKLLNLDLERFEKDRNSPDVLARISQDMSDAAKAGVRSTPSVFVNGRVLRNRSMAGFQEAIENELKKANAGQAQ